MQKKRNEFVRKCPKCNGSGEMAVSNNMAATLRAIGDGATLQDVQRKLKANANTITARLSRLLAQGLVKRDIGADGRTFTYQVSKGE